MALAKSAKIYKVSTTITTVETESFSGHTYPELLAVFPANKLVERTSLDKSPRAKAILELAAERAGWGRSLPPRGGRDISLSHASGKTTQLEGALRENLAQKLFHCGTDFLPRSSASDFSIPGPPEKYDCFFNSRAGYRAQLLDIA